MFGLGWHHCVSKAAQAVTTDGRDQFLGNPISHSTNSGFNRRGELWCGGEDGCPGNAVAGAWRERPGDFLSASAGPSAPWSRAFGVAHDAASAANTRPCCPAASLGATFVFRLEFGDDTGVGHCLLASVSESSVPLCPPQFSESSPRAVGQCLANACSPHPAVGLAPG